MMDTLAFWQATGAKMWNLWRGATDDQHLMLEAARQVGDIMDSRGLYPGDPGARDAGALVTRSFSACAKWVDGGCRILETDAKYFAAMAHTKIAPEVADELRVPWSAFAMKFPPIRSADGRQYGRALFAQFENVLAQKKAGAPWERLNTVFLSVDCGQAIKGGGHAMSLTRYSTDVSLADFFFSETEEKQRMFSEWDEEMLDGDSQIMIMIRRAAAGLLYTMQHTNNFRTLAHRGPTQRGKGLRSGPPTHRTIFVGKPLDLDATAYVQDRAAGRRGSAPSVQTMVRGHIKRQVVGLGGKGRKIVWIEPYWRGPEDAPILSRPYKVGAST